MPHSAKLQPFAPGGCLNPETVPQEGNGRRRESSSTTIFESTTPHRHKRILEWDVCPLGCPYLQEGF